MILRRIIQSVAGREVARRMGGGTAGTIAAAAIPFIAARGLGPLGAALTAGWAAKKVYDWRQKKRLEQQYPPEAVPAIPTAATPA